MVKISAKKLMSLQSRASRSGSKKKSRGRRRKQDMTKRMLKDAAFGGVGGLATSVGLTLAGQYTNQPMLREAGQRGGAIVAGHVGGDIGQITYQVADAIADRYLRYGGMGVSGTAGYGV